MLVHMRNTSELEIFAKKVLRKFWYWYHEKAKKIFSTGPKKLSYKIKNVYETLILKVDDQVFGMPSVTKRLYFSSIAYACE